MAEIVVPFAEFVPVRRGRMVSGHPPLHPDRITDFGLIISRQEGPFCLEIAGIGAYRADAEVQAAP